MEETKLAQKLRVKPKGVNAVALAIGQKVTSEDLVLKVSACGTVFLLFTMELVFDWQFSEFEHSLIQNVRFSE